MKRAIFTSIFLFFLINILFASEVEISNNYIKIITHIGSGRFIIKTTEGNPELDFDNNSLLLCEKYPPTSFTTIQIDDKNYIFGGRHGEFEQVPIRSSQGITCIWSANNIHITQELKFINNPITQNMDTVEISYKIWNRGSKTHRIGFRIVLDTFLGKQDGAVFQIPGIGQVTTEKSLSSSMIPKYWYSCDDLTSPRVCAQGILKIRNFLSPDKVILAGYHRFKNHLWNFPVKEGRSLRKLLFYPNDSAMGIYWKPRKINPKANIAFKTHYGSYASTATNNKIFGLFLGGATVTLGESFILNADIQNITPYKIKKAKAQIILPNGLQLLDKEKTEKEIGSLKPEEIKRVSWNIIPDITVLEKIVYHVKISGITQNKKYIFTAKRIIDVSSEELKKLEREKEKIITKLKKYVKNVKVKKVAEGVSIEFGDVYFEYKSSLLTKEAKKQLNNIGKALKLYKKYSLRVEGYTDNIGSTDYNLKLSHNRAKNVWNFLVYGKYVNPEQAVYQGLGKENPIADNETEDGRNKNRRVEIIIIPKIADK